EILVDAAKFERQGVYGRVGAGAEVDGIAWSGRIEFGTGREALVAQASDEDLCQFDPLPGLRDGRAPFDIAEHVADGVHLGYRMIEFVQRGRKRTSTNSARDDGLPRTRYRESTELPSGCTCSLRIVQIQLRFSLRLAHVNRAVQSDRHRVEHVSLPGVVRPVVDVDHAQ